uniref:PiggyBac transposable element-derived protein domain-containing protein n=1 Tax=Cyprinus carpio TaxID=7962 RepID=A0A8C1XPE6_CYPCA
SVSGGNNVSRGRSVHREVSRRVSVVGNKAGDFYRASVALSSDRVPHRNRGDSGVTRGRGANMHGLSQADGNAGFEYLVNEDEYQSWITPFDQPIGYLGERELSNANSPLDFLSLFLSDDLLVNETNRYAHQFLSELEDYWAEYWPTATPGFGKVMSRNRFEMILSFLHFTNNEECVDRGQPGYDRLFKIRPIINLVIPRFSAMYGPSKQLSLDEMTIAFKGKSTLKMYNPNKPDKYGYKVFVLSEAKSGYVLQWSMYTGQSRPNSSDFCATHLIVRELMAPYTGKGHEVYMDSYYTSPAIADELASNDLGLCGTVSSKRKGMPKGLSREQLPLSKGDDPVFMRKGKMLACARHDTKHLTMLSTLHSNTCVRKRIRTKHTDSGYREINRPVCVDDYNSFMGGVDTADQRMKTYLFPHRSRKWYNRIFNAILSVSMVNAHIIYCSCTAAPHKTLKVFVQDVITALLEGFSRKESNKGRKSSSLGDLPQRLTERHFICQADSYPDCSLSLQQKACYINSFFCLPFIRNDLHC